ncbi:hypothetical protein Vafri_9572, partial [Volvox africanus]
VATPAAAKKAAPAVKPGVAAAGEMPQGLKVPTTPPDLTPVPPGHPNATDIAAESLNVTGAATKTPIVSTIFAPTDAAFQSFATALNLTTPLDLFNATFNATTANITALHVVPGEAITSANMTVTPTVTVPSLLGFNITVTREPDGNITVTIPGSNVVARVVTPDVPYNTSVVQVIDAVLVPPANETATWPIPLAAAANETVPL